MRFIHIGDLHLGKILNEVSLIEDQKYILRQITEIIKDKKADGVLIAGDIYDRSIPNEDAVGLFDSFLTELADMKVAVYAISGNHDSAERLNFGSRLFSANDIYIAGRYGGEVNRIEKEDEYGKVNIWLLPYIKRSEVKHYYPDDEINSYEDALRVAISKCNIDVRERNVIVSHQFVTGENADPELTGSDRSALNVGTLEKVGYRAYDLFDYAALGHIHSAQAVGRAECRYSGSVLKYSLHDREINGRAKSVTLVTLEEKGKVLTEVIELKPLRDIRQIKGKLKYLIENALDTDDYISAILTDEDRNILQPMQQLKEVYPNALSMRYEDKAVLPEETEHIEIRERTFNELITDFYRLMLGEEPSEEELVILDEAAKEAGIK